MKWGQKIGEWKGSGNHEGDFKYSVVNTFTKSLSGAESGKLLTILLNKNLVLGNVESLFFSNLLKPMINCIIANLSSSLAS